jgi:hypothetical protein
MPDAHSDFMRLDTLVKLHAHGLFGWCRRCDRHFDVPLPALIAARGADSPVVKRSSRWQQRGHA